MSDLYGRFMVSYEKSIMMLAKIDKDDAYLDSACFDAQQALEFLMKHILNHRDVPFKKTHDILYLYDLLAESGFTFECSNELLLLASTITSWEEGSRYKDGVHTTKLTVNRVYKIIDSINSSFIQSINPDIDNNILCNIAEEIEPK